MAMRQAVSSCLVQCWCGQCHRLVLPLLCCAVLCCAWGWPKCEALNCNLQKVARVDALFLVFLGLFD